MQATHHILVLYGYPEQHRYPISLNEEAIGPRNHGQASMTYIWFSLLAGYLGLYVYTSSKRRD